MVGPEQLLRPGDADLLGDVDHLAAAVVPATGVALGVLVRQRRAQRGQHGRTGEVLAGDQLQTAAQAVELAGQHARDLGVLLGQGIEVGAVVGHGGEPTEGGQAVGAPCKQVEGAGQCLLHEGRARREGGLRSVVGVGEVVVLGGLRRDEPALAGDRLHQGPTPLDDVAHRQVGRVDGLGQAGELTQGEGAGRRPRVQDHRGRPVLAGRGQDEVGGHDVLRDELAGPEVLARDPVGGQRRERVRLHGRARVPPRPGRLHEELLRAVAQPGLQARPHERLRHRRAADVAGAHVQDAERRHGVSSRSGRTSRSSATDTAPARSTFGVGPVRSRMVEATGSPEVPASR